MIQVLSSRITNMTKKDFELIAGVINSLNFKIESLCTIEKKAIAELFADKLETINPRFDYDKFLIACGIKK